MSNSTEDFLHEEQKSVDEVLLKQQAHSSRLMETHEEKEFSYKFQHVATLGKVLQEGSGNDEFNRPLDVIITKSRFLIVADSENNRLQVFIDESNKWNYYTTIKTPVNFIPNCFALTENGVDEDLWVSGHLTGKALKFSNISQVISNVKKGNADEDQFVILDRSTLPTALFQYNISNDKLKKWCIISEQYEHELEVYDAGMERLFVYARDHGMGQNNDQFFSPHGSCFDYRYGYFIICDTANHRIQIFE